MEHSTRSSTTGINFEASYSRLFLNMKTSYSWKRRMYQRHGWVTASVRQTEPKLPEGMHDNLSIICYYRQKQKDEILPSSAWHQA